MNPTTQQPPFFIVGLPRSRTAWLANFLTYGNGFCLHDALKDCAQPEELQSIFGRLAGQHHGDADSLIPLHFRRIHAAFPAARYVFVWRNRNESFGSCASVMEPFQTVQQTRSAYDRLEPALMEMQAALVHHHTLQVQFEDLDRWETCQKIWEFCIPTQPFNYTRWHMLDEMRVTIIPKKRKQHLDLDRLMDLDQHAVDRSNTQPGIEPLPTAPPHQPGEARALPVRHTTPTALHLEYRQAIVALCGPDQAAAEWLLQLLNVWLTWDHIRDNDPIDKQVAHAAFETMLLDWPANEFYQAHRVILRPVLANAISAWFNSNGEDRKEYDVYVEIPCAVAFLLGGRPRLGQHGPALRNLVRQIAEEHQQLKT